MMQRIYEARDSIEANLIRGLLEQEGIESFVDGSYLQGGVGELPVMGIAGISVEEDDIQQALQLIEDYEAGKFALPDSDSPDT